jgi:tRNA1(Val) A37 N6-methylase TrmN6
VQLTTYRYYGACAPGLETSIAEILKERFPDLALPLLLSGAIVFETAASYDRLNLFCFNNIFRVISDTTNNGQSGQKTMETFVRNVLNRGIGREILAEGKGKSPPPFRVVFSRENIPAAVDEGLRQDTEHYIASLSGLKVDRSNPGVEFWFLLRREGAFFMKRLSRHPTWDKTLHPGELPPPLAWMLCKLAERSIAAEQSAAAERSTAAEPRHGERVADPFCGYGAIPAAQLRHFPPVEFFASDIDAKALAYSKNKFKGKTASSPKHNCHFNRVDARELARIIPPHSLDRIITDPPWGLYEGTAKTASTTPIGEFYGECLKVFAGLLKPGGTAVILCGRGEAADGLKAAAEQNNFTVIRSIPILVSGKKATIFLLQARYKIT